MRRNKSPFAAITMIHTLPTLYAHPFPTFFSHILFPHLFLVQPLITTVFRCCLLTSFPHPHPRSLPTMNYYILDPTSSGGASDSNSIIAQGRMAKYHVFALIYDRALIDSQPCSALCYPSPVCSLQSTISNMLRNFAIYVSSQRECESPISYSLIRDLSIPGSTRSYVGLLDPKSVRMKRPRSDSLLRDLVKQYISRQSYRVSYDNRVSPCMEGNKFPESPAAAVLRLVNIK